MGLVSRQYLAIGLVVVFLVVYLTGVDLLVE